LTTNKTTALNADQISTPRSNDSVNQIRTSQRHQIRRLNVTSCDDRNITNTTASSRASPEALRATQSTAISKASPDQTTALNADRITTPKSINSVEPPTKDAE
jgi:hypothetical protein